MGPIRPPELAIGACAFVLLAASAAGAFQGDGSSGGSSTGAGEVAIIDFSFQPELVETSVGRSISWTNEDSAAHTVTSDGDGPLASGDLAEGDSYEMTFDAAGTYEYLCSIHPTMRGTVEVSS